MPEVVAQPMKPRTINLIVGLIRAYMGLAAEQVVVYNQKWRIPSDNRLYITVGYLAQKPYAAETTFENFGGPGQPAAGLKEIVSVNSQETFSINAMSRGQEVIERKDELVMALASTAAQQLCEANSIKLGRIPVAMTDVSGLDGAAILNRFVVTINALCARRQERVVQYFDQFPTPGLVINP